MMRGALMFGLTLSLAVAAGTARANADPLEEFNRSMFAFNNQVVDHVIDPLSGLVRDWVPPPVREAGARF